MQHPSVPEPEGLQAATVPNGEPSDWEAPPVEWALPKLGAASWEEALRGVSRAEPPLTLASPVQASWEEALRPPEDWRIPTPQPVWNFGEPPVTPTASPPAVDEPSPPVQAVTPDPAPFDPLAQYPEAPTLENRVLENLIDDLQPEVRAETMAPQPEPVKVDPMTAQATHSGESGAPGAEPTLELPWEYPAAPSQFLPVIDVPAQAVEDPVRDEPVSAPAPSHGSAAFPKPSIRRPTSLPSAKILAGGSAVAAAAILLVFFTAPLAPPGPRETSRFENRQALALFPGERAAQRMFRQHRSHAQAVEEALRYHVQQFGRFPPDAGAVERALDQLGYQLRNPYDPKQPVHLILGGKATLPGTVAVQCHAGSYLIQVTDRRGRLIQNGAYDWLVRGDVASLYTPPAGAKGMGARLAVSVPWPHGVPWVSPLLAPPAPKTKPVRVTAPSPAQLAARQRALREKQDADFEEFRRQGIALAYDRKFSNAKAAFSRALALRPAEPTIVSWLQLLEAHAQTDPTKAVLRPSQTVQEALARREQLIRQKMREMGSWEQGALVPAPVAEHPTTH